MSVMTTADSKKKRVVRKSQDRLVTSLLSEWENPSNPPCGSKMLGPNFYSCVFFSLRVKHWLNVQF